MEQYLMYASYAFIALLVLGFLLGFLRNTKRSLIRTIMILSSVVAAVLLAPFLSKTLVSRFVTGLTFSAFGTTLNFEEIARKIISEEAADELFVNSQTINNLAQALMKIFVNVVAFVGILVALLVLTLIIYWIVSIVLHFKERARKEEETQNKSKFGKRALGGFFGIISAVVLSFAFLMPVFGMMNICDGFLASAPQTETEETASAVSMSHVSGRLYYTEDKQIGKVEIYIQKYAEIREAYNNTFAGKFFNTLKISDLGKATFSKLTTSDINGLKINATNELVAVVKLYNGYRENFVANEFDITKNECIDAVWNMYQITNESEIVKNLISEFVPKFTSKWIAGEKFMGIENPVPEEYKAVTNEVLKIFNTTYLTEINKNLEVVKNAVKAANNNAFIKSVQQREDVLEYLAKEKVLVNETEKNQTLVNDVIVELSQSNKIKEALPNITNEMFKMVYELAVNKAETQEQKEALALKFPAFTDEQIAEINWTNEAEKIQNIVQKVAVVFDKLKNAEDGDMQLYLDELANIGSVLDSAKSSTILSNRIKTFMTDFVTEKITLNENIKDQLVNQITTNWEKENFSFETAFAGIQSLANKANELATITEGTIEIEDIKDTIKDIVKDPDMVNTVKELIGTASAENSNIISDIIGEENADTVEVLTEVLDAFMNIQDKYADEENADELIDAAIDEAIEAGQKIVDIVATGELSLGGAGATAEEKQETANEIIETLESSEVIMDMIKGVTENDNSALQSFVDDAVANTTEQEMQMIENAINNLDNQENKETLAKLFGITL